MNTQVLNQSVADSFAGRITFGEVVGQLMDEGVEWYSANLIFGVKTCYAPDLSHHQTAWPECIDLPIAPDFSVAGVDAAIQAVQRKEITYPEFLRRIATAGVTYYTVHLTGRKAIYFGRHGEFHVEPFPGAS